MSLAIIKERLNTILWGTDLATLPGWQVWLIHVARITQAVIRDIAGGLPTLRAMGLVYTTLLSLVPLLAVSFSILKGFGVHNQVEPMLLSLLEPLGEKSIEITEKIIGFVDNVDVKVLGSLSLVFLIYTVISLLTKIEQALNHTWRIKQYRGLVQRISEYISIIMIGPVLIFTAVGISASISNSAVANTLASMESLGFLITIASKVTSFLLIVIAISFIYILVPNTKVRLKSAVTGAVVAAILWRLTGWVFKSFIAGSTNYSAIYSSFAVLIVFMIWMYLSWLILLIGATVSYYHQHPERTSSRHQVLRLSSRLREQLVLLVMLHVGQSFHFNTEKLTERTLALKLDIAPEALSLVVNALLEEGLMSESCDKQRVYMPGKSLEHIRIQDILDTVRQAQESPFLNPNNIASEKTVDELMHNITQSVANTLKDMTLLDMVESSEPETIQAVPGG
jgi:membrane protein